MTKTKSVGMKECSQPMAKPVLRSKFTSKTLGLRALTPFSSRHKKLSDWVGTMDQSILQAKAKTTAERAIRRRILGKRLFRRNKIQSCNPSMKKLKPRPLRPTDYTGRARFIYVSKVKGQVKRRERISKQFSKAVGKVEWSKLTTEVRRALRPLTHVLRPERLIRNHIPVRPIEIPCNRPTLMQPKTPDEMRRYLIRRGIRLNQSMSAMTFFFKLDLLRDVKPRYLQKKKLSQKEKSAQLRGLQILMSNTLHGKNKVSLPVYVLRRKLTALRKTPTSSNSKGSTSRSKLKTAKINTKNKSRRKEISPLGFSLLTLCSPRKMLMQFEQNLLTRDRDRERIFAPSIRRRRYENLKLVMNYVSKINDSIVLKPRVWVHKPKRGLANQKMEMKKRQKNPRSKFNCIFI